MSNERAGSALDPLVWVAVAMFTFIAATALAMAVPSSLRREIWQHGSGWAQVLTTVVGLAVAVWAVREPIRHAALARRAGELQETAAVATQVGYLAEQGLMFAHALGASAAAGGWHIFDSRKREATRLVESLREVASRSEPTVSPPRGPVAVRLAALAVHSSMLALLNFAELQVATSSSGLRITGSTRAYDQYASQFSEAIATLNAVVDMAVEEASAIEERLRFRH